jgi:hypothetical protein
MSQGMVRKGRGSGVGSDLRKVSTEEEDEPSSSTSSTWSSSMSSSRICSICLRSLARIQSGSAISPPAQTARLRCGLWGMWRRRYFSVLFGPVLPAARVFFFFCTPPPEFKTRSPRVGAFPLAHGLVLSKFSMCR